MYCILVYFSVIDRMDDTVDASGRVVSCPLLNHLVGLVRHDGSSSYGSGGGGTNKAGDNLQYKHNLVLSLPVLAFDLT